MNVTAFSIEQRALLSVALDALRDPSQEGPGDKEVRDEAFQKLESGIGELDESQRYILHVAVANHVQDEPTRIALHMAIGPHPAFFDAVEELAVEELLQ